MLTGLFFGQSAFFAFLCSLPVLVLVCGRCACLSSLSLPSLAGVAWKIIRAGIFNQVLELSWIEWSNVVVIGLLLIGLETTISFYVSQKVNNKTRQHGWLFGLVFSMCLFLSYTLTLATIADVTEDVSAQSNKLCSRNGSKNYSLLQMRYSVYY